MNRNVFYMLTGKQKDGAMNERIFVSCGGSNLGWPSKASPLTRAPAGFGGLALGYQSQRAGRQLKAPGASMGGHNFSSAVPPSTLTCTCGCKMKKVLRALHCSEGEISHRFRYNNFFQFLLHISQPRSSYFLLSPDTPGRSWSASYPVFSFSVRLTFVNSGEKWHSPWAPLISPTQNAAIHVLLLKYNIIRHFFCTETNFNDLQLISTIHQFWWEYELEESSGRESYLKWRSVTTRKKYWWACFLKSVLCCNNYCLENQDK